MLSYGAGMELCNIVKKSEHLSAQYLSYEQSKHDKYDRYDSLCVSNLIFGRANYIALQQLKWSIDQTWTNLRN